MAHSSQPPSPGQWRALIDAAAAFQAARPWDRLEEVLFGVAHPDCEEMLYCSILGQLGEVFGLAVFPGAQGLQSYRKVFSETCSSWDPRTQLRSLLISFEDRDHLTKQDYRLLKDLGYTFRGGKKWPQFRSYWPGYLEGLPGPAEAGKMALALRGALEAIRQPWENPSSIPPSASEGDLMPLVRYEPSRDGWTLAWEAPSKTEDSSTSGPPKPDLDEVRLQGLRQKARRGGVWEGAVLQMPVWVEGEHGSAYSPLLAMCADRHSGIVLGFDLSEPSTGADLLVQALTQAMDTTNIIPKRVAVATELSRETLEPLCTTLGIALSVEEDLPSVRKAFQAMQREYLGLDAAEHSDPIDSPRTSPEGIDPGAQLNHPEENGTSLLAAFGEHLASSGLRTATVERHLQNLDLFLNGFLSDPAQEAEHIEDGIPLLDRFFRSWFPARAVWVSPKRVRHIIAGLRKLYAFLYREDLVDREDLILLEDIIQSNQQDWLRIAGEA